MRVMILDCGAIVVKEKENLWLFGAPEGIQDQLNSHGLSPNVVFTTSLKSPGFGHFKDILSFKEQRLSMNGLVANPISHKHGTDYEIVGNGAKILFSERGDVSSKDVEGYDLAIIKNKHRSDQFDEKIVTWPWSTSEFIISDHILNPFEEKSFKVWSKIDDVPDNLKTMDDIPLSLEQINFIARVAEASGEEGKENWAIAKSQFKKSYQKKDGKWVKPETKEKEERNEKLTQEIAQYKDNAGKDAGLKVCANCKYYKTNMSCYKVEGGIKPGGICSIWEYKDPLELSYMETQEKDYVNGRNNPQFIDVLTAYLHKSYNDISDHLFRLGYLSQEERLKVANSIGDGLTAVRNKLEPEEFSKRFIQPFDTEIPQSFKEELLTLNLKETPAIIAGHWSTVFKDNTGQDRWASISSVAIRDRQKEIFTTEAMDWALAFSKLVNFKGPLRFRHVPGLDGGDCDIQRRVGDFLFESGTFRDNWLGHKMKSLMKDPKYGVSLGLAYAKEDLDFNGRYKRAFIFERSMTPVPSVPTTSFLVSTKDSEMNFLEESQLKAIAEELGQPVDEIKLMYERAIKTGGPLGFEGFKEAVLKTNGGGAMTAANDDDDDDKEKETELTKKDMLDILNNLTIAEFKELEDMIEAVKEGMNYDDMDDEEKEEYMKMMRRKKKKEDGEEEYTEDDMVKMMKKKKKETDHLEELILTQTKAINGLIAAMAGQQTERDNQAILKTLGALPRENVDGFLTKTKSGNNKSETDNEILQKLKEMSEKLEKLPGNTDDVYGMFTSQTLNRGK